ncbi:KCNAB2 [Cordylochernes scorpioides]|uniref:KCNAB2 n=1 Tax=Cordylochernes scorpioides TaxID=51811 RepID=A0ABY6KNG3_9ARAC|nr:KCNAB2 [Cordylochernes scorpioides]
MKNRTKAAEEIVTAAYENGINLFDTADIYAGGRSEAMLGKILRKKGWKSRGVQSCLDRLQLDYVDILYINKADPMCPMEGVKNHSKVPRAFSRDIPNILSQRDLPCMYAGTSGSRVYGSPMSPWVSRRCSR